MAKIGNWRATDKQAELYIQSTDDTLFKQLVHMALDAYDNIVALPHPVDEEGGVQGGSNKTMRALATNYFGAAQSLVWNFERKHNVGTEYFPYMVLRARLNGHIAGWMQRLIDKNDGVVPETWEHSDVSPDPKVTKILFAANHNAATFELPIDSFKDTVELLGDLMNEVKGCTAIETQTLVVDTVQRIFGVDIADVEWSFTKQDAPNIIHINW